MRESQILGSRLDDDRETVEFRKRETLRTRVRHHGLKGSEAAIHWTEVTVEAVESNHEAPICRESWNQFWMRLGYDPFVV
jgi:hypothetical protein